jgi:hypothetical protein
MGGLRQPRLSRPGLRPRRTAVHLRAEDRAERQGVPAQGQMTATVAFLVDHLAR